MRTSFVMAIGVSALVIGCSDPTGTRLAASVSGPWVQLQEVPGNSFEMDLDADGTSLSGTGTFQGEAGPGGTMSVEGAVTGETVTLDFTMHAELTGNASTITAHFTGGLKNDELMGTMQFDYPGAAPFSIVFRRKGLLG
jgi:hypothetical protein